MTPADVIRLDRKWQGTKIKKCTCRDSLTGVLLLMRQVSRNYQGDEAMIKTGSYVWRGQRFYFVSVLGKLISFKLPTLRSLKMKIYHLFYTVQEDYDCDGVTLTVNDRLTGGWIYSAYTWNFTRVGGSIGVRIQRFGRPDKGND